MFQFATRVFLVAILLAAAIPAFAQKVDFEPALTALTGRLSATRDQAVLQETLRDRQIIEKMRDTMNHYYKNGTFPEITDPALLQTMRDNLVQRFTAMDATDLTQLRLNFDAGLSSIATRTREMYRATLFYTLAHGDVLDINSSGADSHGWRRVGPSDPAGRSAPVTRTAAEWRATEVRFRQYDADRRAFLIDQGQQDKVQDASRVLQSIRDATGALVDRTPQDLAAMGRDAQVKILRDRAETVLRAQGYTPTASFLDNLAEIHYMMVGYETDVTGKAVLAGVLRLRALEDDLRQREADGTPADLETALGDREHDYGFRDVHPRPTGLLEPAVFSSITRGLYTMTDEGAGLYHGALTHRLQLRAILEDYEQNPERYSESIAKSFSQIGEYDVEHGSVLEGTNGRFDFEPARISSLWYQLFDHFLTNTRMPDLSHPDGVLGQMEALGGLDRITNELRATFNRRSTEGQQVGTDFTNAWKAAGSSGPLAGLTGDLAFMNGNTPVANEAIADIFADLPRIKRNIDKNNAQYPLSRGEEEYRDRVWQVARFHNLEQTAGLQRAQRTLPGGGQEQIPLLVPTGHAFDDTAPAARITQQERDHHQRVMAQLAAAGPPLPGLNDGAGSDDDSEDSAPDLPPEVQAGANDSFETADDSAADVSEGVGADGTATDNSTEGADTREADRDAGPDLPDVVDASAGGANDIGDDLSVDVSEALSSTGSAGAAEDAAPAPQSWEDSPLSLLDFPEVSGFDPAAPADYGLIPSDPEDNTDLADLGAAPDFPSEVERDFRDALSNDHEAVVTEEEQRRRDAERLAELEAESQRQAEEDARRREEGAGDRGEVSGELSAGR